MRKTILISLLLALLPLASAFAEEEVYTLLKEGWSFMSGEEVGDMLGAVGPLKPVQPENPPLIFDFEAYEGTWAILDLEIESVSGTEQYKVFELGGGYVGIFQDPGMDFDAGEDPATGVATATNGEEVLYGYIPHASLILNYIAEIGTIYGDVVWTGGTRFGEISDLGPEQQWWVDDGLSWDPGVYVPTGYHARWAGRFFGLVGTTATAENDWSRVKALY